MFSVLCSLSSCPALPLLLFDFLPYCFMLMEARRKAKARRREKNLSPAVADRRRLPPASNRECDSGQKSTIVAIFVLHEVRGSQMRTALQIHSHCVLYTYRERSPLLQTVSCLHASYILLMRSNVELWFSFFISELYKCLDC